MTGIHQQVPGLYRDKDTSVLPGANEASQQALAGSIECHHTSANLPMFDRIHLRMQADTGTQGWIQDVEEGGYFV